MRTVKMPKNWDNSKGWERYYASVYLNGDYQDHITDFGSLGRHLPEFTSELRSKGWQSIWVPGCGLSPLARVLSGFGFDVHATDISPTAVKFQESAANDVVEYLPSNSIAESPGRFVCEVHDFTQPYLYESFDVILNVKAFQGFSPQYMSSIARVHYNALKPGRQAYFDTMNVQGEKRDIFEQNLVDTGFIIPLFELTRWYRRTLRETNIPHVFILGRPMIQRNGLYSEDDAKWEKDLKILHSIADEYRAKAKAAYEDELNHRGKDSRLATVIYSTG